MIHNLWPTPVYRTRIDTTIAEEMANALLFNYDMNKFPSDFGKINVLENPDESIITFKKNVIYPAFNSFLSESLNKHITDWQGHKMKGWIAGTNNNNYSIGLHNHRGAQISAVFYLMCENQKSGGDITFTDPRQNSNRGYDESFMPWFENLSFVPQTGDIIVFPSFLYHYVSTYQHNIRLALPVDLFLHTHS